MPAQNVLVVTVDGLRATALGAYGNTTFPTPALDQFAAECLLLDACFAASPCLHDIYSALWQSRHPLRPSEAIPHRNLAFPDWFIAHGFTKTLITDDPQLPQLQIAGQFDECIHVSGQAEARADDIAHTGIARLFAAGCDATNIEARAQRLVWLHARGMYGPWDAPLELQETLRYADDPLPVDSIEPPDLMLAGGDDPDTTFRYSCAYAAQVMALDACWEGIMTAIAADKSESGWLVMLLGARGFPLGEHRRIGGIDERLYADQLHVPWLVRFADRKGSLARSNVLVSHFDLIPTVIESVSDDVSARSAESRFDGKSIIPLASDARTRLREALVFGGSSSSRAIRTPAWSLVCNRNSDANQHRNDLDEAGCELYVRPDDRWEANDVAARCSEVAMGLARALNDVVERIERDEPMPADTLPEGLHIPAC